VFCFFGIASDALDFAFVVQVLVEQKLGLLIPLQKPMKGSFCKIRLPGNSKPVNSLISLQSENLVKKKR